MSYSTERLFSDQAGLCYVVLCCVNTGGIEKIIFGTGAKLTVESSKLTATNY